MTVAIQINTVTSMTEIKQRIACLKSWIEIVEELADESPKEAEYKRELAQLEQKIKGF